MEALAFRRFSLHQRGTSETSGIDLTDLKYLRSFELYDSRIFGIPILPASLNTLQCEGSYVPKLASSSLSPVFVQALPNLRVANFARSELCLPLSRFFSSPEPFNLTHLDIGESAVNWQEFVDLGDRGVLKNLSRLRISFEELGDSYLETFLRQLPNLVTLELIKAAITLVSIQGLVTASSSQIKRLVLHNCPRISYDALGWAKEKGIYMAISKSEVEGRPQRTVRYLS